MKLPALAHSAKTTFLALFKGFQEPVGVWLVNWIRECDTGLKGVESPRMDPVVCDRQIGQLDEVASLGNIMLMGMTRV